ncbi:MAG: hypothetical protein ABIP71_15890, partial [Verrucomicrobiota bacterium]
MRNSCLDCFQLRALIDSAILWLGAAAEFSAGTIAFLPERVREAADFFFYIEQKVFQCDGNASS